MRELVTYKRAQYQAFVDEIQREGREITSIFEYQETDDVKALFSKPGVAVDITPFIELRLNEQLAPLYELFLLMMPPDVLFIADEEAAEKGRYLLRNTFSSFKNCEADMEDSQDGEVMEKKTLVSLEDAEYEGVVNILDDELIGQARFKAAFREHSKSFRLFYPLGEQKVFSLLLLGPSGVGKTEVAKILCNAIAPDEPLPKINLGNYSSKDSLNSLIGSPRGYVGSEEGELGRKLDSSKAGVLLIDEFEKAEPSVWNFFLDLLETGTYTDSQSREHELGGYVIVFTTNCPRPQLETTFPAELLSRFSLMAHFFPLSHAEKEKFVERYVSSFSDKYQGLDERPFPSLPDDVVERALKEIDVDAFDNIRILKNATRFWLTSLVESL
mgnify:CR=1 FL=1